MCEQWIPGAPLQYFSSTWERGYVKVTYRGRLVMATTENAPAMLKAQLAKSTWEYLSLVFKDSTSAMILRVFMNSTGVYGSLTHLSLRNKCDCHTYWSAQDFPGTLLLPLPVLACLQCYMIRTSFVLDKQIHIKEVFSVYASQGPS